MVARTRFSPLMSSITTIVPRCSPPPPMRGSTLTFADTTADVASEPSVPSRWISTSTAISGVRMASSATRATIAPMISSALPNTSE